MRYLFNAHRAALCCVFVYHQASADLTAVFVDDQGSIRSVPSDSIIVQGDFNAVSHCVV